MTTSCVYPRQEVSPISSPLVTPKYAPQSTSPIPNSLPSIPLYFNLDVEMGSSPQFQCVEIVGSLHVTLTPEFQNSSSVPDSWPSTPAYVNQDIKMESPLKSPHIEIEDITGQDDDFYMPDNPRLSPDAGSEGITVSEHDWQSPGSRQGQRAGSKDHEGHKPSPTTQMYHPGLNGTFFV